MPDEFVGSLNEEGNGTITIRYGGWRIPVLVRGRILHRGWRIFIRKARLVSGVTLLVAHSVGDTVSILKFSRNMGSTSVWHLSAGPFDLDSKLLEEENVPEGAITEIVRTSYYPFSTSVFFARPSGVCMIDHSSHQSMVILLY